MLHRRTTNTSVSNPPPVHTAPPPASMSISSPPPVKNKAYTPLRRQSSSLYSTSSSGLKARYNLPPASPSYIGLGGLPSYPNLGGTYDLGGGGGGGFGMDGLAGEKSDYGNGGKVVDVLRGGLDKMRRGLADAGKLDKSWSLVWGDRELRTLVIKSTLINLLSLLLLSLSPLIFSPLFPTSPRTKEIGMWYIVLLSWPVFVVCFWINASWAPDISRRAQMLLHPAYRHQPSTPSTSTTTISSSPSAWVFNSLTRLLLISDFTLVTRLLELIPVLGRPAVLTYMCIINSFYCFETTFSSKQWPLDHRVTFMQERTTYMIGFGLPATALSSFGPPLVNMAVFALIYPFCVIQALQSRPPTSRSSLLPTTPSPHSSLPSSPKEGGHNLNNPFFASAGPTEWKLEPKLPIFFFARFALVGLAWVEQAVGRDRGAGRRSFATKERPGKRLM